MLSREKLEIIRESRDIQQSVKHEQSVQCQSLAMTSRALQVRYIVAGNPNTPKEVLAKLANDALENVRCRVAENLRTPVNILERLANDGSINVRLAVAENPNTPLVVLNQLAIDDDVDVRYGVAENPHISPVVLKLLSEDINPYVACRAQKTLKMTTCLA